MVLEIFFSELIDNLKSWRCFIVGHKWRPRMTGGYLCDRCLYFTHRPTPRKWMKY